MAIKSNNISTSNANVSERYEEIEIDFKVDARGSICPVPVIKARKGINKLEIGQVLEILTTFSMSKYSIPAWIRASGQELLLKELTEDSFRFLVKKVN
ncbi:MAG: sulfurtransferase TusA family protein [Candidatus Hodarchaeales archaeon]|jgi:TusA-related sulfurtransferase